MPAEKVQNADPIVVMAPATGGISVGPNAAQRPSFNVESYREMNGQARKSKDEEEDFCGKAYLTIITALTCLIIILIFVFVSKLNETNGKIDLLE
jgi:hypothetical protein